MKAKKEGNTKSKIDLYAIKKVKELRMLKGISQAELANELDMSTGFIGMVESEAYPTRYNLQHLNEIAKVLKCSPQDFLPKTAL